jgi:hypothetical protein
MTDPIRAALDAAAEEVLKNLKDRRGLRQAIEQCDADVQAEIGRTVAAVGNAAFLRALPEDADLVLPSLGPIFPVATLADAVLAAAKDQTND